MTRVGGNNASYQSAVGRIVGLRLRRIKNRILVKLPCRSGYHEAMLRVSGFGVPRMRGPFSFVIVFVNPPQLIGERQRVVLKIKRTGGMNVPLRAGAAGKED